MKLIIVFVLFLISSFTYANEVKVEVTPNRPVAGEVFQAYFRIFTDFDDDPVINFDPLNVEVMGKSNQGVSTRTIYANGKLTVTREITIVYDLMAAKTGNAYIRDINVQLGNKTIRHPSLSLSVIKEPEVLADVMVMVDVPKKEIYLGEGIVVRYYLYSKVPVSNLDIKRYPKLNNFLKRFLQEPERTERVSVDGQLYMRTQIYAAKLYSEKVGTLKVDSLQLSATYPTSRQGDPFGAFGLNRDFKTKTLSSESIKVQVRPLPEPIPPTFTGLVGEHDFQLEFGQSKLIVNQPLEVKLTVTGEGALENLEAPKIINDPGLEEFETNGDLKITNADQATKIFDYTFLAMQNMKLPPKDITLSYFDPAQNKYISKVISLPAIEVAGGGMVAGKSPKKNEKTSTTSTETPPVQRELSKPIINQKMQWKSWLPLVNSALAFLAIIISLGWILREKKFSAIRFNTDVPVVFRKGQFELSEFIKWIAPLIKSTGKSPTLIIKESPLKDESKQYFIDLLAANDYKDYSFRKTQMEFQYRSGHFKELGRYIKSVSNEDSSQVT
jgi:hypothetical protein